MPQVPTHKERLHKGLDLQKNMCKGNKTWKNHGKTMEKHGKTMEKHGETLFPSWGYRFFWGITWYPGILTLGISSLDHGSSMSSRDDPKGPNAIRFQSLRYNVIVCSKYITLW